MAVTAGEIELTIEAKGAKEAARDVGSFEQAAKSAGQAATTAAGHVTQAGGSFSRMGESASKAAGLVATVTKSFGAIGLAGMGISTVTNAAKGLASALGVGLHGEMEQVRAGIQAFTKDSTQTAAILAQVRQEANTTPFGFREMATAMGALLPVSKQAKVNVQDLLKQAEILAASNPLQGLEGASFSLREAMTGDFTSIIERFNLSRQTLNKLKEQGVPALDAIKIAMGEMGFDADLVAAKSQTLSGRWSTFMDTIDTVRMKISEPIFEALGTALDFLSEQFSKNESAINGFADLLAKGFSQAISIAASVLGELGSIAAPIIAQIINWGAQLKSTVIPPVLEVATAVKDQLGSALSAVASFLSPVIDYIKGIAGPFAAGAASVIAFSAAIGGASAVLGPIVAILGGTLLAALGAILSPIGLLATAVGVLAVAWSKNWGDIQGKTQVVVDTIKDVVGTVVEFIQDNWDEISSIASSVWDNVKSVVEEAINSITEIVGSIQDQISDWGGIEGIATSVWNNVREAISTVIDDISELISGIVEFFQEHWSEMEAAAGRIWDTISDAVSTVAQDIKEAISGIRDWWEQNGQEIQQAASKVWDAVMDTVTTAIKVGVGIAIVLWRTFGDDVVDIIKVAWEVVEGVVTGALKIIGGVIQTAVALINGDWGKAWEGIQKITEGATQIIESLIDGAMKAAKIAVTALIEAALGPLEAAWRKVSSVVSDTVSPALSGIERLFNNIRDAISNVLSPLDNLISKLRNVPGAGALGQVVDAVSGGGFAGGTGGLVDPPPGWFWVGEQGAELARVHGGRFEILPHSQSMRAGIGRLPGFQAGTGGYWQQRAAQIAAQFFGQGSPAYNMFLKMIQQESGFNPNAVSSAGAIGIAQFMPGTAAGLGINPWDPEQSLMGAARHVQDLIAQTGSLQGAAWSYNAGLGNFRAGVLPAETREYLRLVLGGGPMPDIPLNLSGGTPTPNTKPTKDAILAQAAANEPPFNLVQRDISRWTGTEQQAVELIKEFTDRIKDQQRYLAELETQYSSLSEAQKASFSGTEVSTAIAMQKKDIENLTTSLKSAKEFLDTVPLSLDNFAVSLAKSLGELERTKDAPAWFSSMMDKLNVALTDGGVKAREAAATAVAGIIMQLRELPTQFGGPLEEEFRTAIAAFLLNPTIETENQLKGVTQRIQTAFALIPEGFDQMSTAAQIAFETVYAKVDAGVLSVEEGAKRWKAAAAILGEGFSELPEVLQNMGARIADGMISGEVSLKEGAERWKAINQIITEDFQKLPENVQQIGIEIAEEITTGTTKGADAIKQWKVVTDIFDKEFQKLPPAAQQAGQQIVDAMRSGQIDAEEAAKNWSAVTKVFGDEFSKLPPMFQDAISQLAPQIAAQVPGIMQQVDDIKNVFSSIPKHLFLQAPQIQAAWNQVQEEFASGRRFTKDEMELIKAAIGMLPPELEKWPPAAQSAFSVLLDQLSKFQISAQDFAISVQNLTKSVAQSFAQMQVSAQQTGAALSMMHQQYGSGSMGLIAMGALQSGGTSTGSIIAPGVGLIRSQDDLGPVNTISLSAAALERYGGNIQAAINDLWAQGAIPREAAFAPGNIHPTGMFGSLGNYQERVNILEAQRLANEALSANTAAVTTNTQAHSVQAPTIDNGTNALGGLGAALADAHVGLADLYSGFRDATPSVTELGASGSDTAKDISGLGDAAKDAASVMEANSDAARVASEEKRYMAEGAAQHGTSSAVPGWYWVGEAGRELINMHGGEAVLPHELSEALNTMYSLDHLGGFAMGTYSHYLSGLSSASAVNVSAGETVPMGGYPIDTDKMADAVASGVRIGMEDSAKAGYMSGDVYLDSKKIAGRVETQLERVGKAAY